MGQGVLVVGNANRTYFLAVHVLVLAVRVGRNSYRFGVLLLGLMGLAWWIVTFSCPQTEFLP
jgi:hypothetical protein